MEEIYDLKNTSERNRILQLYLSENNEFIDFEEVVSELLKRSQLDSLLLVFNFKKQLTSSIIRKTITRKKISSINKRNVVPYVERTQDKYTDHKLINYYDYDFQENKFIDNCGLKDCTYNVSGYVFSRLMLSFEYNAPSDYQKMYLTQILVHGNTFAYNDYNNITKNYDIYGLVPSLEESSKCLIESEHLKNRLDHLRGSITFRNSLPYYADLISKKWLQYNSELSKNKIRIFMERGMNNYDILKKITSYNNIQYTVTVTDNINNSNEMFFQKELIRIVNYDVVRAIEDEFKILIDKPTLLIPAESPLKDVYEKGTEPLMKRIDHIIIDWDKTIEKHMVNYQANPIIDDIKLKEKFINALKSLYIQYDKSYDGLFEAITSKGGIPKPNDLLNSLLKIDKSQKTREFRQDILHLL